MPPTDGTLAAVACDLGYAGFSCERVYTIRGTSGGSGRWHRDGRKLGDNEPDQKDPDLPGLLAVRLLGTTPNGDVCIGFWDVRDWEQTFVSPTIIFERPEPGNPNYLC